MTSNFVLFVAGILMLWVGASGLHAGEIGLTLGIVMPSIKFKRGRSPVGFWICAAFYLALGVWMTGLALFRFVAR